MKFKGLKKFKLILKHLMGKRLYCKYIRKKHVYEFRSAKWERIGKYRQRVHINCCKTCWHCKKYYV